jgi:hypothetical protein
MAPVQNKQVIFCEIPEGFPEPGKHTKLVTSQIDPDTVPLNGGLLTKNLVLCQSLISLFWCSLAIFLTSDVPLRSSFSAYSYGTIDKLTHTQNTPFNITYSRRPVPTRPNASREPEIIRARLRERQTDQQPRDRSRLALREFRVQAWRPCNVSFFVFKRKPLAEKTICCYWPGLWNVFV